MNQFTEPRLKESLQSGDLPRLFTQDLGWDRHNATLVIPLGEERYTLNAVAQKRGVQVFECQPDGQGNIPDYNTRRKIEKQVTKSAYEHLIVFVNADKSTQVWQWVARQPGQPAAYREHAFHPRQQSGEALIQKLRRISFPLSEEETLDLATVVHRLRDALDRDKVTKKFYDRFKAEHAAFLKFIRGVTQQGDREWYASLMLNRLMFVYFIQKQGFLDGDDHYLRNRLNAVQTENGQGKFHSFYRFFLLKLFHEGFAKQPAERDLDAGFKKLLGEVPYLNGGLFDPHDLETRYQDEIDIPDEAFEKLFEFFDQYEWHLDTRPISSQREINPDVLGYIFEKYINQKQMGAYYTKEDITDYISKNTIIPFLFDAAKKKCVVAFQPGSALWRLLQDDPDAYLYPAVRKGVIDDAGEVIPLPKEIEQGVADVSQRGGWNKPASKQYALPTETWREHVARRQRCLELRGKLAAGEVHAINDLVTYNLNIRQFAEDVISTSEGPELVRAFWQAIRDVTVLDPTCGSGAFLFAALGILQPLYEACLDRMQAFVEDHDRLAPSPSGEGRGEGSQAPSPLGEGRGEGASSSSRKFSDFRKVLAEIDQHPSRDYFILKSIVVHNLYGVDIMEEAVEICKLRLFLKLVAQVDRADQLEPLPDIDFNIRPGNTLVGFATLDDVKRTLHKSHSKTETVQTLKGFEEADEVARIVEDAEIVERAFRKFHEMQTEHGIDAREFAEQKQELRRRLSALNGQLDRYLAADYGVVAQGKLETGFVRWKASHLPFHWFVEFHRILRSGGFHVVIGNPPYVELSEVREQYELRGLDLVETGNLYSVCLERCRGLLAPRGRLGVITPISAVSTPRMNPLMRMLVADFAPLHVSNFAVRPAKLFNGVDMNLTIFVGKRDEEPTRADLFSTRYTRWQEAFRPVLFDTLSYQRSEFEAETSCIPKLGSDIDSALLEKIKGFIPLSDFLDSGSASDRVYYHSGGRYFRKCLREKLSNEYKELITRQGTGDAVIALLSSSLYYWFWIAVSDCYHVTKRDVHSMFLPASLVADAEGHVLAEQLVQDLYKNARTNDRARADGSRQQEVSFQVGLSRHVLDHIDRLLATHYGLTDEELDWVLGFDAKYRANGAEE